MNSSEVLNKAADLIEEYGWVQGELGNKHLGFCAMGAICVSGGDKWINRWPAIKRLGVTINDGIAAWNDTPGRTKEEVISKLREAANG